MNNWRYKRSYLSESSIRVQVSNMSLVKSAFVLLSALLSQSCTQALPSPYEWIDIPQKQPDDVAPLSPPIDRSSPKSDFLAGKVLVSGSTFGESDEYNRQFFMNPKHYSEAHGKHSNFEHFPKSHHHDRPRYLGRHRSSIKTNPFERHMKEFSNARSIVGMDIPGSFIASGTFSGPGNFVGDIYVTQPDTASTQQFKNKFKTPGERYITREELFSEVRAIEKVLQKLTSAVIQIEDRLNSNTFTTSPQPPVLNDPRVTSDSEPSREEVSVTYPTATYPTVTYPTVTTSPQPPVLIDPSVSSDLKPTESSVEGVSSPTVTTSPQPPVLSDRSGVSELGPTEANNEEEVAYPTVASSVQLPSLIHFGQAVQQQPIKFLYKDGSSNLILRTAMELPDFNYPEDNNELQAAKPLY